MRPDLEAIRAGFPRRVPVFPLGQVVLFPGAILPLHVFEPRYREMVADSLAGNRLVGMGLLRQCSNAEYEDAPPYHETICVGTIVHHRALDGGRSHIVLLGVSAGRAIALPPARAYREAEVDLVADKLDLGADADARLEQLVARTMPRDRDGAAVSEELARYVDPAELQSSLLNTCALTAPILPLHKLEMLQESSLQRRLELLTLYLDRPWQWN